MDQHPSATARLPLAEPSQSGVPVLSVFVSGPVSGVVSAQDAALLLGVNERTVRRAIQRGELVARKAGRSFEITQEALDHYRARLRRPKRDGPLLHLVPDVVQPAAPTFLPSV